jgi:FtsP/CotA-like multicopper oxidase with cupredoxin domain
MPCDFFPFREERQHGPRAPQPGAEQLPSDPGRGRADVMMGKDFAASTFTRPTGTATWSAYAGNTWTCCRRSDRAQAVAADMIPDMVGTSMFHCHLDDHRKGGMQRLYQVLDNAREAASGSK